MDSRSQIGWQLQIRLIKYFVKVLINISIPIHKNKQEAEIIAVALSIALGTGSFRTVLMALDSFTES